MPRLASLKAGFIGLVLGVGCTPNPLYLVLTCKWKVGDMVAEQTYCLQVNNGLCLNYQPEAEEWCAWNVFSSQSQDDIDKFKPPAEGDADIVTKKGGLCVGGGNGELESKKFPPDPQNPGNTCNDGATTTTSAATSDSATDPTTSGTDGTTGGPGETSDTTGGPAQDIYFCSQQSPWKCANLDPDSALADDGIVDPYTNPMIPTHAGWDACWCEVSDAPPALSKCVEAISEADARNKCQIACEEYRKVLQDLCTTDVDCALVSTIDCALDGTYLNSSGQMIMGDPEGEQPILTSQLPGFACDGEPIKLSDGPYLPFAGSAGLVTPEGVSAGLGSFRGFLGYKLSDCNPGKCTITIDTLVGLTRDAEGGYSDASGMGGLFELKGMGFQASAPLVGIWHKNRKRLTFPSTELNAQFWANSLLVDGLEVTPGYSAYPVEIDQVVGSLAAEGGPLSLNLVADMQVYGVVTVNVRTLPP